MANWAGNPERPTKRAATEEFAVSHQNLSYHVDKLREVPETPAESNGATRKETAVKEGFFSSLFDFKFDKLITIRVMSFLYTLFVFGAGVWGLLWVLSGVRRGGGGVAFALVVGGVGFLLATVIVRIYLEVVVVLFRILENVQNINTAVTAPAVSAASPGKEAPPAGSTDGTS